MALRDQKVSGALEKQAPGNLRQELESLAAHCTTGT